MVWLLCYGGQRARLLLQRSELESFRKSSLLFVNSSENNEKKRGWDGTLTNFFSVGSYLRW